MQFNNELSVSEYAINEYAVKIVATNVGKRVFNSLVLFPNYSSWYVHDDKEKVSR